LFEKVTKPSGVVEFKHTIVAANDAVAIRTLRSNGLDDTRYLHKDHLGSVDTITNESGAVVARLSFDALGTRRDAASWSGSPKSTDWTAIAATTHRGFTGHEALDNVGLVHMNGRVYDPKIGRFLFADPFVQSPLMSQSLNRYSYVMNNPLSFTDPSGFFLKSFRRKLTNWVKERLIDIVITAASAWLCAPAAVVCATSLSFMFHQVSKPEQYGQISGWNSGMQSPQSSSSSNWEQGGPGALAKSGLAGTGAFLRGARGGSGLESSPVRQSEFLRKACRWLKSISRSSETTHQILR
jgi:RHS repeat-associated protein